MKKKIAIIHDFLVRYGGAESLVKAWSEEYPNSPIYTLFYDEKKMGKFFLKERIRTSYLQKWYNITKRYTWMLPFMPKAIESFDLSEFDVVLSSSAAFSHGVLTNYEQKHISYIHSPMRWAWDYYFKFMKERKMGVFKRWIFQWIISKIRIWDITASSRSDLLIAASTTIKNRIHKYWKRESEVIFPFADTNTFCLPNKKISKEYFLIVSQLVPYKRIDIAIKACETLNQKLIIVGEGIERKRLELLAGNYTQFLGFLKKEDIVPIMQNAKAFLFPGIDDFGITPVEAMACGVPVIAFKKGGILDILKEGISGEFFDEQSSESLINILKNTDYSKYESQKIRDIAINFNRENHIKKIKQIIDS